MIKDSELLKKFEDEQVIKDDMTYLEKLKLLDSMYEYAVKIGVLPPKDPLEGIEENIRLAKVLNGIRENNS